MFFCYFKLLKYSIYSFSYLIAEDFFLAQSLDWRNLLQALHIEMLLITEDHHAVWLAYDILLLEVRDVLQGE